MTTESTNILDQFKIEDATKAAKIENVSKKRISIAEEDEKTMTDYQSSFKKIISGDKTVQATQVLSLLDQGLARGKEFEGEVSDLAFGLTGELNELGQFFGDISQYSGGLEKTLAFLGTKTGMTAVTRIADRYRMGRVKSADVNQNLKTILSYGAHMINQLQSRTLDAQKSYNSIAAILEETTEALKTNQPIYEKWQTEREALGRQVAALEAKMDKATQAEFAILSREKASLLQELGKAQTNENHYFTIVKNTKDAIPTQEKYLKAFEDMRGALITMKTGLETNIQSVTALYQATPVAVQIALATKAAGQYDVGMKKTTRAGLDTTLKAVRGVLDEAGTIAERPLVTPEEMENFRNMQVAMESNYSQRFDELKDAHSKPKADSQVGG